MASEPTRSTSRCSASSIRTATPAIERYGQRFAVGDKVMQIENDYDKEVYNGDLGVVRAIAVDEETMTVEFDGRAVTFDFGDLDRLVLAYATTVHKAQGSEYPAVVIPVTTQHYPMLQRHLLYTGVTRGKRLVVLVGQLRALAIAVRGTQTRRRWSQLRGLLSPVSPLTVPRPWRTLHVCRSSVPSTSRTRPHSP